MTMTMFVLYAGKITQGFENTSLNTVYTNNYTKRMGKAFKKPANEEVLLLIIIT